MGLKVHAETARLLVSTGGADPYQSVHGGESPMMLLRRLGTPEALQLLSSLDSLCSASEGASASIDRDCEEGAAKDDQGAESDDEWEEYGTDEEDDGNVGNSDEDDDDEGCDEDEDGEEE